MRIIAENMTSVFHADKLAGSYFLLFILSLIIIYNTNKERNRYYVLFAVGILLLLIMNPVSVWILARVFPALASYTPFVLWIPTLIFIPFAGVELLSNIKSVGRRHAVTVMVVIIIALSGNVFGLYRTQTYASYTEEHKSIINELNQNKDSLVLADETIVPAIRGYGDGITLLYGKDLWTPHMDLGIMEEYNEDMLALYEAMKNPKDCIQDITSMASMYECDIIVLRKYNGYRKSSGSYQMVNQTQNYLVYEKQ